MASSPDIPLVVPACPALALSAMSVPTCPTLNLFNHKHTCIQCGHRSLFMKSSHDDTLYFSNFYLTLFGYIFVWIVENT